MSAEDEMFVDPASVTVAIGRGEMVIMPVDCDPAEWCKVAAQIPGLLAYPLPDSRVLVERRD